MQYTADNAGGRDSVNTYLGEDGFFALLGTNNRKAVARMLTKRRKQFSYKTNAKARIYLLAECGACIA